jgi:hypothetical protein
MRALRVIRFLVSGYHRNGFGTLHILFIVAEDTNKYHWVTACINK